MHKTTIAVFSLILAVLPAFAADRALVQTVDTATARVQPQAIGFFRGESVTYTVTPRYGSAAISVSSNATAYWTACYASNINAGVINVTGTVTTAGVATFSLAVTNTLMPAGTYDSFVRIQDGASLVTASRSSLTVFKSPYAGTTTFPSLSFLEPLWSAASNSVIRTNQVDGITIIWTNGQLKAVSAIASETDPIWSAASNLYYRASNPSNFCTLAAAAALTNGLISATEGTNIALAVVAPYTNHQDRTDNPHGVTAGQVGALPTGTVYVASEQDTNALARLAAHSNLVAFTAHPGTGSAATNQTDDFATAAEGDLASTAWQNPISATNWTWTSDGAAITLTNYTGPNAVVIPDMLNGLKVVSVGTSLRFNTSIVSVSGGANIASIGSLAFYSCTALASVTLFGVTNLGEQAFLDCYTLTTVTLSSIAGIDDEAFGSCSALTGVYFSGNAPTAGSNIYLNATSVTNYVTSPTATGWGATWNGRPVVRLPIYASNFTAAGVGASPTGHVHSAGDITNLQSTVAGYGYLTNITPAQVAAAGGLTNIAVFHTPTALYSAPTVTVTKAQIDAWPMGEATMSLTSTVSLLTFSGLVTNDAGTWAISIIGTNGYTLDTNNLYGASAAVAAATNSATLPNEYLFRKVSGDIKPFVRITSR